MQNIGVGLDWPVVVYDNRDYKMAARGAWLLDVFGHNDISIIYERV